MRIKYAILASSNYLIQILYLSVYFRHSDRFDKNFNHIELISANLECPTAFIMDKLMLKVRRKVCSK